MHPRFLKPVSWFALVVIFAALVDVEASHLPSSDVRRGRQEEGEAEVTNEVGGGTGVIGTVRSFSDLQPTGDFSYSFETENGIKQEAYGESRSIGEAEVIVMRGSYEFIGDDGLTYVVEWEADEKGFRASAPHLPKPVEIPFAEQAAAVEAQVRFAELEAEAAAARNGRTSFLEDDSAFLAPGDATFSDDEVVEAFGGRKKRNRHRFGTKVDGSSLSL